MTKRRQGLPGTPGVYVEKKLIATEGVLTEHLDPLTLGNGAPSVFSGNLRVWRVQSDRHTCTVPAAGHGPGQVVKGASKTYALGNLIAHHGDPILESGSKNAVIKGPELPKRKRPRKKDGGVNKGKPFADGSATVVNCPFLDGPTTSSISVCEAIAGGSPVYVNGMITSYDGALYGAMQLACGSPSGRAVLVYNASDGFFGDIFQSMGDKLWNLSGNAATATLASIMQNCGAGFDLYAGSQGAIIASKALDIAQTNGVDISGMNVNTLGGAASNYPDGPNYNHYHFDNDPVSLTLGVDNPIVLPGPGAIVSHGPENEYLGTLDPESKEKVDRHFGFL